MVYVVSLRFSRVTPLVIKLALPSRVKIRSLKFSVSLLIASEKLISTLVTAVLRGLVRLVILVRVGMVLSSTQLKPLPPTPLLPSVSCTPLAVTNN